MLNTDNAISTAPRADGRITRWLGVWLLLVWIIAAIAPSYRQDWLLENILVFAGAAVVLPNYRRLPWSTGTYMALTLFLTLHLIGAHYTYSETPIGDWMAAAFDWQRNHYDRLVHFSFGLLLAPALQQLIRYQAGARRGWDLVLTAAVVLGLSGLFEIIEAIAAMIVSPELGLAYLGTQGDIWDAQKDSALALLGGVLYVLWLAVRRRFDR